MLRKWILIFSLMLTFGFLAAQVNITPIRTDVTGFADWTDTNVVGTTYLQLLVADANTISPAMNFNNYTSETLNFKARTYGGTNTVENEITVSISIDNGANWTVLGTRTPTSTTLTAQAAFDLSSYSGTQVKVKFSVAGTNNGVGAGIDDIAITGISGTPVPTLTVSPATLTGFTYVTGSGPSTTQTFTVSGTNLSGNISIAATTNYEISLSAATGYATPLTLTQSGGIVNSTTIYVRLKSGLAAGSYNSEVINVTSTGATAQTVTCSGSVTDPLPTDGYLVNFEGATEVKTSYASGTVNLSGLDWDLTLALIGTSTADWKNGVRSARLQGYGTSAMSMLADKTTGLGVLSFQYRRYGTDTQVDWKVEYSTNQGSSWIQIGDAFTAPASDVVQTFTSSALNLSGNVRIRIKRATETGTSNARLNIDDISLTDYSGGTPTPSISITPNTLSGFTYVAGSGPSAAQSFSISGANLTNNISLAASTNYEISLNAASGYATPLTLTQSGGIVNSTTIYVRLKSGLAAGNYNSEVINATSTGATAQTVTCSGSVTAPAAPNAPVATDATNITANSFSANWGSVAGATSYKLDVYTRESTGGNVSELFISEYIEGSSFNKAIEIYNGTGADVDLSSYSLKKQSNGAGGFTGITLSGTLAAGDVYVVAHSSANAAILAVADRTVASTPVDFNGNDAVALYNGETQVDVVGVVDNAAIWGADVTLVRKATAVVPNTTYSVDDWDSYASDTTTYLGTHTRSRTLTYVPGYQDLSVGNVTTYAISGLSAATTYYYVVRAVNANGTSANSNEKSALTLAGSTAPDAPVATDASSIGVTSFVANWNASATASSYRLDVSTVNTFVSFVTGYNNLTVSGTSQNVSGLSANTMYYYRVRAVNAFGTSANSNTITVTTLQNDPFNGYYNPVAGLSGAALKTGLHDLIDNNTYSNYDGAKLELFQVLDNNAGVVRCVYTGQDYTVNSTYDGSTNPNTEHTYAQSWFSSTEESIKKADVHHLFITNSSVNSSRGNLPFDVVSSASTTYPTYNGYVSKRGTNATGQTVFEPADQHKGNLARALLYFHVRYGQSLSQGGVDMVNRLVTWHNADPVDTDELERNAAVFAHQNNRNPFVDHPEYVTSIFGGTPSTTIVQFSPASATVNEAAGTVTLTVQISNPSSTATTAQVVLSDGSAADVNNYTTANLTFPANSSANQTVTVTVTDDSIMEGTETLVFSLQNVSGGNSAAAGVYGSFNLTIEDNDIPAPVATAASGIAATGLTANWNAAAGITEYEIDLSTSATFASFVSGYEAYLVSGTTLAITGLTGNTQYYYRVRSLYNQGLSISSNAITATTLAPVTPTATVVLRPTQIDISDAVSESAVLMTVQNYPSNDAKYRLYNGGNNYNAWDAVTSTYISSSSYAAGPNIPGTPTTTTTWWIPFTRGNNATTVASYRDRLNPYSTNYQTTALPAATAITNPASILMSQVPFTTWNTYTSKYVVLGYDALTGGTLISATSTNLADGNFNLKVESGTTIRRIEIRDLNNNLIEAVTGSWPQTLNPEIVVVGEPDPLFNIAGAPSEEITSYQLQGVDLTSNIIVLAPQHFEISLTGTSAWTDSLSLSPAFDGSIYVRLNSSVVGEHSGDITHNSTGATEVTLRVEGETLAPSAIINVTANFTAFTQETGTPSASQSYTVSGSNLTGNINIVVEAPFQISQNGTTAWGSTLSLVSSYNGNVFVRLNGDTVGTYTGKKITHTSADASPVEITVNGSINVPSGPVANLFFSEYLEGSSNNKALEIFNASGAAVDLSRYKVELYSNGSATVSSSLILSGTLAAGGVYVITNSGATNATIIAQSDVTSNVTFFNGDDALALRCLNPDTIIDVFGEIGVDPGTGWAVAGTANATVDKTLIRKPTVASGNTDYAAQFGTTAADSEWIVQGLDYVTDLGVHTYNPGAQYTEVPVFSPAGGTYMNTVSVTLSSATAGAAIRYTTNGTDPTTTTGTLYAGAFNVSATTTVKAIAYAAGYEPSTIVSATYTLPTPISDIATLRLQPTSNLYAYRLTGEAVLTYQNSTRNTKYIQDATAAIVIDDNGGIITSTYNLYDGITGIVGYLNPYNGLLQFIPLANPGAATSTNNVIVPEVRTLDSLVPADQGKLVKIMNTTITHATYTAFPATAQNLNATDATGTRTLRTFVNTDYANTPIPAEPVNMICLVGQFNTGMQVSPRFLSDFQAIGGDLDTPVVTITLSGSNVVLDWADVPGATYYKVWHSDDPTTGFTVLDANVTISQKTIPASAAKKFYYVTAHN